MRKAILKCEECDGRGYIKEEVLTVLNGVRGYITHKAQCNFCKGSGEIECSDVQLSMIEGGRKMIVTAKKRGFERVADTHAKHDIVDCILPTKGSNSAMAYDFYAPADITIEPGKVGKIWTDVKSYMGDAEGLIINVRSSMGGIFMLANTSGWIDADYYGNVGNDGNIGIFLLNISGQSQFIKKGDRIAQGAFFNILSADSGDTTTNRVGGFGSSGK